MSEPLQKSPKPARWIAIAFGVMVFGFIAVLATRNPIGDPDRPSQLVGKIAPEITGVSILDNKPVSLSSLESRNKFVLVNFFSSTCIPCVTEHPELVTIAEKYSADVSIMSVMFNENATDAKAFFAKRGGTWPVVDSPRTAVDYGVALIPETFLVDPDGYVLFRAAGPVTAKAFARLLTEAKAQRAPKP